jgi:hypothetical protein
MLPYTIVIVLGIHRYEAKIKRIKNDLDILETDFFDLYNEYCNKSSNAQHYTQIQLDNIDLRKTISDLDVANKLLQQQNRQLRESLLESRPIQYESSRYKHPVYANQQELEMDSLFERQIDFE